MFLDEQCTICSLCSPAGHGPLVLKRGRDGSLVSTRNEPVCTLAPDAARYALVVPVALSKRLPSEVIAAAQLAPTAHRYHIDVHDRGL